MACAKLEQTQHGGIFKRNGARGTRYGRSRHFRPRRRFSVVESKRIEKRPAADERTPEERHAAFINEHEERIRRVEEAIEQVRESEVRRKRSTSRPLAGPAADATPTDTPNANGRRQRDRRAFRWVAALVSRV